MSLFAAGTALATQAGVSAGTAMAAGAAAEIIVGTANIEEFRESEAHVLVNSLHDAADIASVHTSNLRPAKKPRATYSDPNEIFVRNVKVTRQSMDGMHALVASDNKRQKFSTHVDDDLVIPSGQPNNNYNSDELDLLLQDSQPLLEPPEEPDPEPHDAMLHAMRCGSGTSAILNKEGASAKYFTVESQAEPVQSVDAAGNAVGYGLWRWDLSLSQFRYKSPCNEFLSIYMNYRIRKVQVHFYLIKLDTQYTAGRSTKKVATSLEDLASQTFTQFESSQYAADSFATELAGNSLPRVGPVAAVFIPLNKDQGLNADF